MMGSMGFDPAYLFRGANLTEVAMPLGGIGAGCVSLEARGAFRDWEIFGRPNKNSFAENTFALLWSRPEGGKTDVRTVQGPRTKDFLGVGSNYGSGHLYQGEGLPCFAEAECEAKFPGIRIGLRDPSCPLTVRLEAFSPFFPLDDRAASMPIAVLRYKLRNPSDRPVDASLCMSVMNPVGGFPMDPAHDKDQATSDVIRRAGLTGVLFGNARYGEGDPLAGTFALSTDWGEASVMPRWFEGSWFDALQDFWNRFAADGRLREDVPNVRGFRMPASIALRARVEPGQVVEMPIAMSWLFPFADRYWDTKFEPQAGVWKRYAATQWADAWAVAAEFFERKEELMRKSYAFQQALFESDLPSEVSATIGYTASTLRTPTVDRLEDGTLWAWEGCNEKSGCCHGTCSHVWNYALTQAYLFPDLYRGMLKSHFDHGFKCGPMGDQGAMNFRLMLPMAHGSPLWHAAIDGQLGLAVQLYRTWKREGNEQLLREYWPKAKSALEFAWVQWDRDRDGLVDGDMHNTYDINFQGPNPLGQMFYLAALQACERMARAVGDDASADSYASLYASGRILTREKLWNGEFYEQRLEAFGEEVPKYQHGLGCLSDQLLGALHARLAGLDDPQSEEEIGKALDAIYEHNFRDPIGDHVNLQRSYIARDETGLVLCTWPNGGRPEYPFVYSDEVWTGIEYQVATHLAQFGRTEEALRIVQSVRERHDGTRRNPYNEVECGSHYARALSAYGLLLAWPRSGRRLFVDVDAWGVEESDGTRTVHS